MTKKEQRKKIVTAAMNSRYGIQVVLSSIVLLLHLIDRFFQWLLLLPSGKIDSLDF